MYLVLDFQISKKTVFIPDGYVNDLKELQNSFLMWMEDQPESIHHDRSSGYMYDEATVLKYINDVVLADSREQAYFVSSPRNGHKRIPIISF